MEAGRAFGMEGAGKGGEGQLGGELTLPGGGVAPARHPALRALQQVPPGGRQAHGSDGTCGDTASSGGTAPAGTGCRALGLAP